MQTINHIQKVYLFLACTLLGTALHGMEGEKNDKSWLPTQEGRIAAWLAAVELAPQADIQDPGLMQRVASRERLRKSGISKGMRDWQDTPAQAVPRTADLKGGYIKLREQITDVALIPYTKKVLLSAYNTLYRCDLDTKNTQALAFARPIAKLIQSADGSLCGVLLTPNEGEDPLIRFVNSCKSTFELNTEIEPIPCLQTDEYELGQEADLSADARFLATVSTTASASVHDLKKNAPHAIMLKNAEEFPVFSVNFLKPNDLHQNPDAKPTCAVQSNLATTIYAIDETGCTPLQKIALCPFARGHKYFARQSAWLLPGKLIVLLGTNLLAFDTAKKDAYEFKQQVCEVNPENELYQCSTNRTLFIEQNHTKKNIILHDLRNLKMGKLSNPHNDRVLMDESETMAVISKKNELMLVTKNEQANEAAKK